MVLREPGKSSCLIVLQTLYYFIWFVHYCPIGTVMTHSMILLSYFDQSIENYSYNLRYRSASLSSKFKFKSKSSTATSTFYLEYMFCQHVIVKMLLSLIKTELY